MPCLFAYGTLKKGQCRHQTLLNSRFIDFAQTQACYRLIDLGDYPGLIHCETGSSVPGELYEIADELWNTLDTIEGVDDGFYHRTAVSLLPPFENLPTLTYIYLRSTEGLPEISAWPPEKSNQ